MTRTDKDDKFVVPTWEQIAASRKDEIWRLRQELASVVAERDALRAEIERLKVYEVEFNKHAGFLMTHGMLGRVSYENEPSSPGPKAQTDCPRARSDMTPCVVRDGATALAADGRCVGCGLHE